MKLSSRFFAAAVSALLLFSNAAMAGIIIVQAPRAAPTLEEGGLLALGAVVGIAGAIAIFRRKK